ncbi:MAG TPA: DUF2339 domain-containing protein [Candidatus Krumholzibacteria bacterium]|nr:DUF2339 domain-containing protein [Candidatus Krumholzibacteria bacterium]
MVELLVVVVLGLIALIIVTFIMMLVTRGELGRLRREVAELRGRGPAPVPVSAPAPAPIPSSPPVAPAPRPRVPRPTADLEKIIGGQWLTWLGVLAIFLGTAFFLAVDLGDSPLRGLPQVLIAGAVSLVFLAVGRLLVHRAQRPLGLGLLGGGIALLDLAAYGLFGFHRLVAVEVVFPALLGVAFLGALVALAQDAMSIAVLTLLGALLTPLVLTSEAGAAYTLLPYLVAVDFGSVLVGRRRGWAALPLGAFAGTALLVARWWGPHYADQALTLVLVTTTVIWLLYGLVPWLGRVRPGFWTLARTALVAANGAWYAMIVYAALGPEGHRGAALFVIALMYVVVSVRAGGGRRDDPAVIANFYTGAALAVVAVPVQWDGFSISLAWSMVGLLLLVMGWRLDDPHHRIAALAGLAFAALRILMAGFAGVGGQDATFTPVLNLPFLADAGVVAALLLAGWMQGRCGPAQLELERLLRAGVNPAAAVTAWWVITMETARYMESHDAPGLPVVTVALVWALYAAMLQAVGVHRRRVWPRVLALPALAAAAVASVVIQGLAAADAGDEWRVLANAGFAGGTATVAVLAWIARRNRRGGDAVAPWEARLGPPLLVATLGAALVVVSLEILAWFRAAHRGNVLEDAAALLTLSIAWTAYGGALIGAGFGAKSRLVRLTGMAVLALVIVKVFAIDVRVLEAGYRIGSFVGVGGLFLVVSLVYQRERRG